MDLGYATQDLWEEPDIFTAGLEEARRLEQEAAERRQKKRYPPVPKFKEARRVILPLKAGPAMPAS
eukprot:10067224-Alexandrium_andersonii.AAC.1